jgi:CubicO group peptidase (beta-lactamase class C family)
MSKPITSVAVMMLYEEGHFALEDPVGKYLPELAELELWVEGKDPETGEMTGGPEPAPRPITIRDLLRHSSGFSYGIFSTSAVDKMYVDNNILLEKDLAELVSDLSELPLLYAPGTRWHYGVSIDVLGRLVEVVSGKSFGEFLEERLFAPLGMKDTRFRLRPGEEERLAKLYARTQDEEGKTVFVDAPPEWSAHIGPDATFESGGGGLLSTAHDYLLFCRMLLGGGELDGKRILSRKTVELMASDHTATLDVPYPFPGYGFGLGFAVVLHPGTAGELGSAGAYRWAGAAGTGFFIDPAEDMVAVFMTQFLDAQGGKLRKEMRRLAYQAIDD